MRVLIAIVYCTMAFLARAQSLQLDYKAIYARTTLDHDTPMLRAGGKRGMGWQVGYIQHLKHFDLGLAVLRYIPEPYVFFEDRKTGYSNRPQSHGLYRYLSPNLYIGKRFGLTERLFIRANINLHYSYRQLGGLISGALNYDTVMTYNVRHRPELWHGWRFRPEGGLSVGWKILQRLNLEVGASYIYDNEPSTTISIDYHIYNGPQKGDYKNRAISDGSAWILSAGLKFNFSKYRIIITDELKYDDK